MSETNQRIPGKTAGIDWRKYSEKDIEKAGGLAAFARLLGVSPNAVRTGIARAKARKGRPPDAGGRPKQPLPADFDPDAKISDICAKYDVSAPLATRWRREARGSSLISFLLVMSVTAAVIVAFGQCVARMLVAETALKSKPTQTHEIRSR